MELAFSLPQLLGLYFLIIGAIVLYRRRAIMPAIAQLAANRPVLLVLALVELLAGLAIVLTQPALVVSSEGLIALIGWMLIVESIIYIAAPYKRVQKFIRAFNTPQWYGVGGVISLLIGLYLTAIGFGFIAG